MEAFIQVITTFGKEEDARAVAERLLKLRLIACVQIINCRSMYRWQGGIQDDNEYLCVMKTREDLFEKLRSKIEEIHPYDCPELMAVPIVHGLDAYFDWLRDELLPPE